MKNLIFLGTILLLSSTASANFDQRWNPWVGCWELIDDEQKEPFVDSSQDGADSLPINGLVCLRPTEDQTGVTVETTSDGNQFFEETVIANGKRNPSSKGNCKGWQQNNWSNDGHRLFTKAKLTCNNPGDGKFSTREITVTGLSMMTPPMNWTEVQVVESSTGRAVVIRRYRPAEDNRNVSNNAFHSPYGVVTEPMSVTDVVEASRYVAPEAIEVAILEHDEGFDLNSNTLLQLDEANIRPAIIDLMVALTFPDQFNVKQDHTSYSYGGRRPFGNPYYYRSSFPYSFSYPYYLVPFGYYYWYAPYDPYYVVRPMRTPAIRHGRVTKNGYTQISTRSNSGSRGNSLVGSSSGSNSSSSSSGSVTSGGYTNSGGGKRKAKPRRN